MNTATHEQPAYEIILEQLGGRPRLCAMLGAQHFFHDEAGTALSFKMAAGNMKGAKANYLKIKLEADDTYTVTACKIRGLNVKPAGELEGVHAEDLVRVCESLTGLAFRF